MELFGIASGKEATDRVVELLDQVALGPAVLKYQASRLSGGERQRVAIARALAAEPDVLVCDEITSALDVSVQGSIVALLEALRQSPRHQHAVRDPQPRAGALDRRPRADPQGGPGRRVRPGRRGDGLARRRSTPSACSRTARGSTDGRPGRQSAGPGSPGSRSPTPSTMPAGRTSWCRPSRRRDRLPPRARASLRVEIAGAGRTRDLEEWLAETHGDVAAGARRRRRARRARVVRRRARARHPVPRRLDDQVGAGPPGRAARSHDGALAPRPTRSPTTCPSSRAPATPRHHGARPAHHDHRRRLGRGPPRPGQPRLAGCSRCFAGAGGDSRDAAGRRSTRTSLPAPAASYCTADSQVLDWVRERATGHDLRRRRWRGCGAASAAPATPSSRVDAPGVAMAGGGLAATRARLGPGGGCSQLDGTAYGGAAARRRLGRSSRPAGVPVHRARPAAQHHHHARRLRLPLVADGRRRRQPGDRRRQPRPVRATSTATGASWS